MPPVVDSSPLHVVLWTIGITLTFLGLYDMYRLGRYGRAGTISRQLWVLGTKYPVILFWAGFTIGALFGILAMHFWSVAAA